MDPVIQKVIHDLEEKTKQVEEQILSGRMATHEMYLAQIAMRQAYRAVIADIKKAEDEHNKQDRQAGSRAD